MAEISAQLVKELRERTGAGMMDCKKALVEAKGDLPEAEIVLRKKGIASAGNKESRSAKQGLVAASISPDGKLGVLVEVNCESDFVARTDDFQKLAADIAAHIAITKPKHVRLEDVTENERALIKAHETLYEQKMGAEGHTVGELVKTKIAKLGENIVVSRFTIYQVTGNGVVGHYIHTGSQIGVILEVGASKAESAAKEEFKTLVRDLAMQVAAAHPQVVGRDQLPAALVAKEMDIQKDRVRAEGKPEKMLDKIAEGRMSKFYEEVCLLEQPFIRENTITITDLIKTANGKIGDTVTVSRFVRYKVGDSGDAPGVEASPLPVTA
jgi:elongation factor Ts